jgi:hypothetical protein
LLFQIKIFSFTPMNTTIRQALVAAVKKSSWKA